MPNLLNIRCDCHGTKILGQVEDGFLVIRDRRDRQIHEVRVDLGQLIEEFRKVAHTKRIEAAGQPTPTRTGTVHWPTRT